MRFSIGVKIIGITMLCSLLLGTTITAVAYYTLINIERDGELLLERANEECTNIATDALSELGKNQITTTAEHVALHIDTYLRDHPRLTTEDLMKDKVFQEISVIPVGTTGYTVTLHAEKAMWTSHRNPALIGARFDSIEIFKQPIFGELREIIKQLTALRSTSGSYKWIEPDGSITDKYLSLVIGKEVTADGAHIAVSATTYLQEFNARAADIKYSIEKQRRLHKELASEMSREIFATAVTVIFAALFTIILLAILIVRSIVSPIRVLTAASEHIASGDTASQIPIIQSADEISVLSKAMHDMHQSLHSATQELEKLKDNLTEQVRERTKDLEEAKHDAETKLARIEELKRLEREHEDKINELRMSIINKTNSHSQST